MENLTELRINGTRVRVNADPERSLLSVLRDDLDLTGAKYGCGEGQCAACTVLIDGIAARSCQVKAGAVSAEQTLSFRGFDDAFSTGSSWPRRNRLRR